MEIKPVLILENSSGGLLLNESVSAPKDDKFILSGPFTEFDVKNRNDRVYTKDKFLPHLNELVTRITTLGAVYGEFDHPEAFDISLSRISHIIESATYNQEKNRIDGSIRLLSTHYGKEAKALIMDGCPIFVSSRAAGITESDGTVTIKKLFTYDAVADPGFASARMELRSLNESLGFNESVNFRVYDMSDESKINNLFEMNNNDLVTQKQFSEYSDYLKTQLVNIQEEMNKNVKDGNDPSNLVKLAEQYAVLMENYNKMTKYLDYLAEQFQILVNDKETLSEKTDKLVLHNDYLAEQLEKSISYSNYLAEKIDDNIDYSEYVAEKLSQSIDFSEYIAENVDKSIKYSDYIAENLDKSIDYSEYVAEHTEFNLKNIEMLSEYVDNSIKYSEYVAEQVDNNIAYSEYLAEHVDNNIKYSEYVAEHVDNNIAYSEYIAENLADNQAYSKYIAESLDKTIDAVKGNKLNEEFEGENPISDMKVTNIDKYYEDEEDSDNFEPVQNDIDLPNEISDIEDEEEDEDEIQQTQVQEEPIQSAQPIEEPIQSEEPVQLIEEPIQTQVQIQEEPKVQSEIILTPGDLVEIETNDGSEQSGEVVSFNAQDGFAIVKISAIKPAQVQPQAQVQEEPVQIDGQIQQPQAQIQSQIQPQVQIDDEIKVHESKLHIVGDRIVENEISIKDSINKLITEAKKRKAADENEPHFLLFLNDKNKALWNDLSYEDKEKVKVAMNESTYTSEREVLNVIRETIINNSKTEEQILIDAIPTDLVETWNGLNDTVKKSVLAKAKFYTNLTSSQAKMESFWNSRGLEEFSLNENKQLINENKQQIISDIKITDSELDRYLNIFKRIK